jgi:hypothetical protein
MTVYEPMPVEISESDLPDGRKQLVPSPAHDPGWDRIDTLRWRAGIIKSRSGITVTFNDEFPDEAGAWPDVIGMTVLSDSYRSSSVIPDYWMDCFLSGVEVGTMAVHPVRGLDAWQPQDVRLCKV